MKTFSRQSGLNILPDYEVTGKLLTIEERKQFRDIIDTGVTVYEKMTTDEKLDRSDKKYLRFLFPSVGDINDVDPEKLKERVQKLELEYFEKLRVTAQRSLTAYHEYMNIAEFPSKHHIFVAEALEKLESGEYNNLLLSMPPGTAKPLHRETKVLLADGRTKELHRVVIGDKLLTMYNTPTEVVRTFKVGMKETYEILLEDGRKILAAEDHPFPIKTSDDEELSVDVTDMVAGDYLYDAVKKVFVRVQEVNPGGYESFMVCLEVKDDSHTFLIEGGITTYNSSYASRSFIQWCLGRRPWWKILAAGYADRFTKTEFSKPNRNAISQEEYKEIFPNVEIKAGDSAADKWVIKDFGGAYYVRTPGSMTSGIRADLFALDDIIGSVEQARSAVEREKVWQWVVSDVLPRANPDRRLLMIGTRWHSEDPLCRMEEQVKEDPDSLIGKTEVINISAEGGSGNPVVRKKGEWIWPERYDASHFESIRASMDPDIWSASYLGVPVDRQGGIITENDFVLYNELTEEMLENGRVTITVDTAEKTKATSNRTAIITLLHMKNIDIVYVVDAWYGKQPMNVVVPELRRLIDKWHPYQILLEDANMGAQIIENYTDELDNLLVPIYNQNKGSKQFNMESYLVPAIRNKVLRLPKNKQFTVEIINEICGFPTGRYDDIVDALAQYFRFDANTVQLKSKPLEIV